MKKVIIQLLKFALSSVIALAVLSAVAFIYDNSPIMIQSNELFTRAKYEPGQFWSYMKEGFGYGITNKDGFNNAYLPNDFVPRTDANVLVLGSSHVQAIHLPEDENFVYLLNQKLHSDNRNDNDLMCYNAGVSGSFIANTSSTCKYIKDYFDDLDFIVFESSALDYPDDLLEDYLAGKYDTHSRPSTMGKLIQLIPGVRMMYSNFSDLLKNEFPETVAEQDASKTFSYEKISDAVTDNIASSARECGAKAILIYHSFINIDENGVPSIPEAKQYEAYKKACEEKGIIFADVTDLFYKHYIETFQLPYGFSNTTPGKGHLNSVGHSLIAERLYEIINDNLGEDK